MKTPVTNKQSKRVKFVQGNKSTNNLSISINRLIIRFLLRHPTAVLTAKIYHPHIPGIRLMLKKTTNQKYAVKLLYSIFRVSLPTHTVNLKHQKFAELAHVKYLR